MHTLEVKNLAKTYSNKTVVRNISLNVKSGEIVGLLGPNGSGKTTSFYMIVGLIRADCGQVLLNDEDISQLAIHQRAQKGLGYLPQENSIFRGLNVEQNMMAMVELKPHLSTQQRQKIVDTLLADFNIEHLRKQSSISLSGGERRRLEIARALAIAPQFILLDEPFAGIDPISILEIKEIITQLRARQLGILITDHNVRETLQIADRTYIVNHGEIICQGTPETILADATVREVYLGKDIF